MAGTAEAGPFRRGRRTSGVANYSTGSYQQSGGDTSTAQGVAEIQARTGRMGHYGGNRGREGVGMGSTRESAINNCCFHPSNGRRDAKINIADVGAAQGSNGMWYACIRE